MVEVRVSPSFSGEVVLNTDCRDGTAGVRPGESLTLTRQAVGETCDIALEITGREAYTATIGEYESTTLEVDARGEVSVENREL